MIINELQELSGVNLMPWIKFTEAFFCINRRIQGHVDAMRGKKYQLIQCLENRTVFYLTSFMTIWLECDSN